MNVLNSQSSEVLGRCVSQDLLGVSVTRMGRRPHFRSIVGFFELRTMGLEIVFRCFLGCWWCTKWHQIAQSVEYPTIFFLLCHLVKDFVHEHLEGSNEGSCCKMTLNENREVRSQKFHFDWKPSRWRFCRESFSASSHSIWQGLVSEKKWLLEEWV